VRTQGVYEDPTVPVVVLNPGRHVTPAHAAEAETYVRRGGRLLVLDDPVERSGSTAWELLGRFGIACQLEVVESEFFTAEGPPLPALVWALPLALLGETRQRPGTPIIERGGISVSLTGVVPRLVDKSGLIVYGTKTLGRGRVHAFGRSSVFSQLVMGDVWGGTDPGPWKKQIYALEFALLEDLFAEGQSGTPDLSGRSPDKLGLKR
jgi:hypothetical protein